MPAVDVCEPQVIKALDKAGWDVKQRQYSIRLRRRSSRYVHADLLLIHRNTQQQLIVVEVKCFNESPSLLSEFYCAVGQYLFYRNALKWDQKTEVLYLAIPESIYARLLEVPAVGLMLTEVKVNLIIVDLEREEIKQWITRT